MIENKKEKNKGNILDLYKFIGALMVMGIHLDIGGEKYNHYFYPILYIAVPMFFYVSFYLLIQHGSERGYITRWIKKNYITYIKYSLIFSPFIVIYTYKAYSKDWFEILKNIVWGRSIGPYWYIVAICFGGGIGFVVSNVFKLDYSVKKLLIIIILTYFPISLSSSYEIEQTKWINMGSSFVTGGAFYLSFGCAVPWFFVAKLFVCILEKNWFNRLLEHIWIVKLLSVISIVILYIEWFFVKNIMGNGGNGMFSLLLCVFVLFLMTQLLETARVPICIRKISTYIYFCHIPIGTTVGYFLNRLLNADINNLFGNVLRYMITFLLIIFLYFIIKKISNYKERRL